jgi:hypothetical protein
MKEKKMWSWTLEDYHSMDLKTFASYCQFFKLNEMVKAGEIAKYFKKYAENGTWLSI